MKMDLLVTQHAAPSEQPSEVTEDVAVRLAKQPSEPSLIPLKDVEVQLDQQPSPRVDADGNVIPHRDADVRGKVSQEQFLEEATAMVGAENVTEIIAARFSSQDQPSLYVWFMIKLC